MIGHNPFLMAAIGIALVSALPANGAVYRWVDETGAVSFSDRLTASAEGAASATPASSRHVLKVRLPSSRTQATLGTDSAHGLGPLPSPTTRSEYLEPDSAGFILKVNRLAQYRVVFNAKDTLPDEALLVVRYQDPSGDQQGLVDTVQRIDSNRQIRTESPFFTSLKCGTYSIDVEIYSDSTKRRPLEVFRHQVRSVIDIDRPESEGELVDAILNGNCS